MINVNGIKRNAKNIVKKYSDATVKVREATSNDPWGPSSTIMAEIADLTYNVVAFSEIMQMIWKRLNDHGKNWRHVYKALVLLEYLIKTGTEKVAQQCTENIFAIQTLKDFQYMEDSKDYGMNIREKSKKLVALLKDSEKLKAERARALKAKARLAEAMSSVSKNSLGAMMSASANGDPSGGLSTNGSDHLGMHMAGGPSSSGNPQARASRMPGSDIDSARPHSLTEEEQQLRLALALSKEEAEQQEKTRKHDELRLKLALDVSKKTSATPATSATQNSFLLDDFNELPSSQVSTADPVIATPAPSSLNHQSKSAIDDLLGLSIPPPNESALPTLPILNTQATATNPVNSSALLSNPMSSIFSKPQNDPWSSDPWEIPSTTLPTAQYTATPLTQQYTATSLAQQAASFNLTPSNPLTMAPTIANNTTAAISTSMAMPFTPTNLSLLGDNNGFTMNNNGANNNQTSTTNSNNMRRPMSNNPFAD